MSKLFSILISAVMLSGGLVAFSATAAHAECPYTGCIPTNTFILGADDITVGQRQRFCVRVGTDGNGDAKGRVTVVVERGRGGFEWKDSEKYTGEKVCFRTPRLEQKGNYIIAAKFDKRPGSRWKDSDNRDEFRVRRG